MAKDINIQEVGSVIADDTSPSFDIFRFKANANEFVYPGTLVATSVDDEKFLIGRISSSIEINPHESGSRAKVREALNIPGDYPKEDMSINIFRIYEAEIIEEGYLTEKGELDIFEPSDMPKAGAIVFIPSEDIIADAMGFEKDRENSICIGKTRVTTDIEKTSIEDNVLLKPYVIQRHIFVGGTTGSGKSFSTGILLEEINKFGLPIVILDSQKEYIGLAEGLGGKVLIPGKDYTVRISSLSESELLGLVPTLRGTIGYDLLAYTFIRLKREILSKRRDTFGLHDLLDEMSVDAPTLEVNARSLNLGLARTRTSIERHNFLGEQTNWEALIKKEPVINIDCANLDQSQLQLVVGSTLRELQKLRKNYKIPPHVIVLDEAHLLVPEGEDSPCKQVIRENVRIGRHYGICMVLLTQSPVDIDKKTIRQCNTRMIFALEPDQLDSIRGVKADASDNILRRLPKMPVGTCLLSGTYETIKHALPIKVRSDRKTEIGGATPDIFHEIKERWGHSG